MLVLYFFIGATLGSFICLVAERIPMQRSIVHPRSHCTFCHQTLHFFELIPIFSILLLRFRCYHCSKKLSTTYFLSELASGFIFMTILSQGLSLQTVYHSFLFLMTLLLSLTDIYYLRVEPMLFYPLFFVICLIHFYSQRPFYFVATLIIFISLSVFNYFLHDSLGGGDVLLISAFSLLIELELLLRLLLIASSSGLLFLLFANLLLKSNIRQLPFVPFLTIGLFTVLYF